MCLGAICERRIEDNEATRSDNGAESVAGGTRMFEISGTSEVARLWQVFISFETARYLGVSERGRKTN